MTEEIMLLICCKFGIGEKHQKGKTLGVFIQTFPLANGVSSDERNRLRLLIILYPRVYGQCKINLNLSMCRTNFNRLRMDLILVEIKARAYM